MIFTLRFFPPLQNAVCFIILTCLVPVLFTFYIQSVLKLKKNNSGAKRLTQKRAILSRRIKNQMINKQGYLGRKILTCLVPVLFTFYI